MYLHEHKNFRELIEITAREEGINDPALVEKDYWIMQCLYGLSNIGLAIDLKGGTSLSKGYGIIQRFSEDIDIKIEPDEKIVGFKVYTGKNQDKENHRESRKKYFEWLRHSLRGKIPGIIEIKIDENFTDTKKYRNGGLRLIYFPSFETPKGIKEGILLEVGFDKTTPNQKLDISSWAFNKGYSVLKDEIKDNRAKGIPCYEPKYTFVEKLQTVVRKYRLYKEGTYKGALPTAFLRHYYDLYCLLEHEDVTSFIGTDAYTNFKLERFGGDDTVIAHCEGLRLDDPKERELFKTEYARTSALYYKGQVPFEELLGRLTKFLPRL